MDINWRELYTITHILAPKHAKNWFGKRVLFRCDNSTAVSYINARFGKIPQLEKLSANLDKLEQKFQFVSLATHLSGKNNPIADAASRIQGWDRMWNRDVYKDIALTKRWVKTIGARMGSYPEFGGFDVDAFCDPKGFNSRVENGTFFSQRQTAFDQDFEKKSVWAFPPKYVQKHWLEKVVTLEKVKLVVSIIFADPKPTFSTIGVVKV